MQITINHVLERLNSLLDGFSLAGTTNTHYIIQTPVFKKNNESVLLYVPISNGIVANAENYNFIISDNKETLDADYYLLDQPDVNNMLTDMVTSTSNMQLKDDEIIITTNLINLNQDMLAYLNMVIGLDKFI